MGVHQSTLSGPNTMFLRLPVLLLALFAVLCAVQASSVNESNDLSLEADSEGRCCRKRTCGYSYRRVWKQFCTRKFLWICDRWRRRRVSVRAYGCRTRTFCGRNAVAATGVKSVFADAFKIVYSRNH